MNNLKSDVPFGVREFAFVGSQVTCFPAPPIEKSDRDYLVLVWSLNRAEKKLSNSGWVIERDRTAYGFRNSNFFSARRINGTNENLIVTNSKIFFKKFMYATEIATRLNLLEKDDRIKLFQFVLYGR